MSLMSQTDLVAEFANRRRRAFWFGGLPFALGIVICFAAFGPYTFGLETGTVIMIGFGIAALSIIPMALIYRCPVCGARIMSAGMSSGTAFDFSAAKCPRCGVSFAPPS